MTSKKNPTGEVVIDLDDPIEHNGQRFERVTMRPPRVRDLRAANRGAGAGAANADVELRLFANLCEIAPEALDEMTVRDYGRLQRAYEGFLRGRSTSAEAVH